MITLIIFGTVKPQGGEGRWRETCVAGGDVIRETSQEAGFMVTPEPNKPENTERQVRFEPTSKDWDVQEGTQTFGGGPPKPRMSMPMMVGAIAVLVIIVLVLAFVVF